MPFVQTKHLDTIPVKTSALKVGDIFIEDNEWEVYEMVRFQTSQADGQEEAVGKVVGYQRMPRDEFTQEKFLKLGNEMEFFGDGAYGPCLYLVEEYWAPEPSEIISSNG